ncbi:MAG: helix-turn-helix domain-containing protein [Deltaproteobacteria bacterium]|nr:helix-turn-helix domain-containing protein [Deltaproteobacteria bacterium]
MESARDTNASYDRSSSSLCRLQRRPSHRQVQRDRLDQRPGGGGSRRRRDQDRLGKVPHGGRRARDRRARRSPRAPRLRGLPRRMTIAEIAFIKATFNLDSRALAKALNVSPATVGRWESGESEPTGLQAEVLRALHNVALQVQNDEVQKQIVAGLIVLGIGALIFYLLTRNQQA